MTLEQIAGAAHYLPGRVNIGVLLGETLRLWDLELEILPLPGHSIGQIGVLTEDAAFLGDALVAPEILTRYPIQYCYDVLAHRETLARLALLQKAWYVGAHFNPTPDLEGLLAANRRNLERTADAVLEALASPASTEAVVAAVAAALGVPPMDPAAYMLNSAVIKAHLSAHVREARLTFEVRDHRPVWCRQT
ncbi:MAG TPA: hypothetical protein VF579_12155 [Candidatus Methylomirabilis sp.]